MNDLNLHSKIKDYQVSFENDLGFLKTLHQVQPHIVIADKNILKLYGELFRESFPGDDVIPFEAIEENKTIESCLSLYEQIIRKAPKKNMTIISIGGGITQDVTGFVSSTLYRGVKWIYIPTTFLAQTDSCIGSKTSLNFKSYKNLIGTFYPPERIVINTKFLHTLSKLDFYSGIGEAIKLQLMKVDGTKDIGQIKALIDKAILKDESLISLIRDNMQIKISYMENDEFDQGRRNLLNYGHCFGHALETASGYHIPHGIAVTIGILFANIIAHRRKLIAQEYLHNLATGLILPNIPVKLDRSFFDDSLLLESMKKDKKNIGELLTVIIPDNNLQIIKVDDLTDQEVKEGNHILVKMLFTEEASHG